MADRFIDNTDESRFELHVDGHLAVADYFREGGVMTLPHVEADLPLRGTGAASRLMEQVAAAARAEGLKIRPVCSYAVAWMRRHPEASDLLA